MNTKLRIALASLLVGISYAACSLPGLTSPQEMAPSPLPTEMPEPLLPRSLYFLSKGDGDYMQVWRMEADGTAQSQITFEPDDVAEFDVSQKDGSVVYVVNNQLYWVDASGAGRRLLIDGGALDSRAEYNYRRRIRSPLWSPDGTVIAFGQDGLVFYQFSTGMTNNPITNEIRELEEGSYIPIRILSPEKWSPDGMKLIYNIGHYEGSSAGVFDLAAVETFEFDAEAACCFMTWSADSRFVLMASPYVVYTSSGLWRYDTTTHEKTTLIAGEKDTGGFSFASYPLETADGELYFFYAELEDIPDGSLPMLAVRSTLSAPLEMIPIWNEALPVYEVLWADDGSLVLMVQPVGETIDYPYHGPVVRISFAKNESQTILIDGQNLRWGPK